MKPRRRTRARSLGSSPDGFGLEERRPKTADEKAIEGAEQIASEIKERMQSSDWGLSHSASDHTEALSNCPRCAVIALLAVIARRDKKIESLRRYREGIEGLPVGTLSGLEQR